MKNRKGKFIGFTAETTAAFILSAFVFVGTLVYIAPFSTINDALADYKDNYEYTIGVPPYPHAELSTLADLMDKVRINPEKAYQLLDAKGIKYAPDKTLKEIGNANGMKPSDIFAIIKPAKETVKPVSTVPAGEGKIDMTKYEGLMGSGMGNKSVADAAAMSGITTEEALARLAKYGVKASADDSLKIVAGGAAMTPMDVYIVIDSGLKP